MVEHYFVRKYQPSAIPAKEAVAKDPEKKGTTKTRSFFCACLGYARQEKKVFLCAFVSLWFKAFYLLRHPPS